MERFIVKHYACDAHPSIKGNGFDGLPVAETREEAEAFINFVNEHMFRASEDKESAPSASSNSRYESAMAVYVEYCEAAAPEFKETFDNWLRERLHSPKAANVS